MITRSVARKRKSEGNDLEFSSLTPKRRSTRKQGRLKKRNKYRVHLSDSISIFHDQKLSKHGEVYEGEQRHGDFASLAIAVKVVDENELTEARILAKLNHHSHVISLIDSGFYHNGFVNRVYMALDKCHKENLREYITNRKKQGIIFDINRTTEIANQIIEGVEYIHSKKIIHKDLKPDNILFSLDQKMIKIADFGLSEEIDSVLAKVSVKGHFGTAGYRPPESFGNSIISLKSDIYSLGIILYYILSNGEHPFGDDPDDWNSKMKNGLFDLSKLLVTNPNTTKHLIECMIEIKLSNRPTISQVSLHPCWSGNEVECSFDYHCDETSDIPTRNEEEASEHNVGDLWKLVEMMEKRTRKNLEKNPDISEWFQCRKLYFKLNTDMEQVKWNVQQRIQMAMEEVRKLQDGQQASTSRGQTTLIINAQKKHKVERERWAKAAETDSRNGEPPAKWQILCAACKNFLTTGDKLRHIENMYTIVKDKEFFGLTKTTFMKTWGLAGLAYYHCRGCGEKVAFGMVPQNKLYPVLWIKKIILQNEEGNILIPKKRKNLPFKIGNIVDDSEDDDMYEKIDET